jgi:hypothetical protein
VGSRPGRSMDSRGTVVAPPTFSQAPGRRRATPSNSAWKTRSNYPVVFAAFGLKDLKNAGSLGQTSISLVRRGLSIATVNSFASTYLLRRRVLFRGREPSHALFLRQCSPSRKKSDSYRRLRLAELKHLHRPIKLPFIQKVGDPQAFVVV